MQISRREFLKLSGAGTGGMLAAGALGVDSVLAGPPVPIRLHKKIGETVSVCAYCGAGCGVLVAADGKQVTGVEGYPDHPINQGALCSKAQALYQTRTVNGKLNPRRMTKVLYRAPNGTSWEEKSWDWALEQIAKKVKETRDAGWTEKDKDGILVNRTEAIAHLGGAAHDNEECYLLAKMSRALGMVYIEHQARI